MTAADRQAPVFGEPDASGLADGERAQQLAEQCRADVALGRERSELTREASDFFDRVTEVREALRGTHVGDTVSGIDDR